MKYKTEDLIASLIGNVEAHIAEAEKFNQLSEEKLNWKVNPDSWSILECLEHLNLYGDFYIPEIKKRLKGNKSVPNSTFKSGLLGNYFANSMLPKKKLNKMNTFKDKNPSGSNLDKKTIDRFINQQKDIHLLLDESRNINLAKTKTSISISNFIKLKLGDTFRFVINHNERHIIQANNVLKNK